MKAESVTLPPLLSQNLAGNCGAKQGHSPVTDTVCPGRTGIKAGLLVPHKMKELLFTGTWTWPMTKGRALGGQGYDQFENGDEGGH